MNTKIDRKLQERLLLARRVEGDSLLLADAVLLAALDGACPLNAAQSDALQNSPLTLRRFRHLALNRRARAANDTAWSGSAGMLRAASDGAALARLVTDDQHWQLHFVMQDGAWRIILSLDGAAPFAARLMREQPLLRVLDGAGASMLQGRLDADGEIEAAWPFATAPAPHFQQVGAAFAIEPAQG
jgi:hypothetical protein